MNDLILTFNYTNTTPNAIQSTPENSIGGYISSNSIYTSTTSPGRINKSTTTIPVVSLPSSTTGLAQVNIETVEYTGIDTTNSQLINVDRGKVPNANPDGFPHGITPYSPTIRYLDVNGLFNPNFDRELIQYRCIGIKNSSSIEVENVSVILIEDNTSDVDTDIGIEVPFHDYRTGSITTATSNLIFIDSSLAGLYVDNYFADSALTITSGAAAGNTSVISSYDGLTGTFVLSTSPGTLAIGNDYEILPAPSQSVQNHLTAPSLNGYFFGFIGGGGSPSIGYQDVRENGAVFRQNDVFYLWIKRILPKNATSKSNTSSVILFRYLHSGS